MSKTYGGKAYRCRICGDIIKAAYTGEFKACRCGAIAIHFQRMIGAVDNFENFEEKASGTRPSNSPT